MTITFLGTGTSQGVPVIACNCEVCTSPDPRDKRLRSSILIETEGKVIVIDSGPDFRYQMLRAKVKHLDAIVFTHEHKDHIAGFDADLFSGLAIGDIWMSTAMNRDHPQSQKTFALQDFAKRAMRGLAGYDYVLIDTPPNLGVMTVNAFVACSDVIIPVALTTYALIGITILESTMQELRDNLDVELPILGVVGCLDDHTRLSADVLGAIREHFGALVFDSIIPRNIKVEEAHNRISSLFEYAPTSNGAKAYEALTREVITRAER